MEFLENKAKKKRLEQSKKLKKGQEQAAEDEEDIVD